MLNIFLFVLVPQIGFNIARSNSVYRNPRFPPSRLVNVEKTRRQSDSDSYLALSSRGIPASDSVQSDSEYSSVEDYDFRSNRPLHRRSYNRRSDYLTSKNRQEYDVSSESALDGKIDSNSFSDSLESSSSSVSRQTYPNYRRPYILRPRLLNIRQEQSRNKYRKANDDVSYEVLSEETSKSEDTSRVDEEAGYHQLFFSFADEPNSKRDHNRKYYVLGDNLSREASPNDKLNPDEDAVNSLPNIPHQRRNYRKEYDHLLLRSLSPANIIPGVHDTILLLSDDATSEKATIKKSKLRKLSLKDLASPLLRNSDRKEHKNRQKNHRHFLRLLKLHDYVTLDNDVASHLSKLPSVTLYAFNLEPVYLRRSVPSNNKYRTKENIRSNKDNKLGIISVQRLGSLDIPHIESSLRKNRYPNNSNNNNINLSRNKTTIEALKQLSNANSVKNLVTYINKSKNRRKENQYKNNDYSDEFSLDTLFDFNKDDDYDESLELSDKVVSNLSVLRLTNKDNLNLEPWRTSDINLSKQNNTIDALHLEFPWNDPSLFNNDMFSSNASALRDLDLQLTGRKNTNKTKGDNNVTDSLHLEFPWNDLMSPNDEKSSKHLKFPWNDENAKLSFFPNFRSLSELQSQEQKEDSKDITDSLHLQFPWNDERVPDDNKHRKLSTVPSLRSPTQLRSQEQRDNRNNTAAKQHLGFPWNDHLSPDDDKNSSSVSALRDLESRLRTREKENTTNNTIDSLHLEFPWNDLLNPDDDKNSQLSATTDSLPPLTAIKSPSQFKSNEQKDNTDDTKNSLQLELVWSNELGLDDIKSNEPSVLPSNRSASQLRSQDQKDNRKDTTNSLHHPWNKQLSSNKNKTFSQGELKLGFPGNDKTSDRKKRPETVVRSPDPLYIHPYLRDRNMQKQPNYFTQSNDDVSEGGSLLEKRKACPDKCHRKIGSQSLKSLSTSSEKLEKDADDIKDSNEGDDVITFPLERRAQRLTTFTENTPMLTTTTDRSN